MPEGVQVPVAQKPAQAPPQASAQYEARKELDRRTPTATLPHILAAPGCTGSDRASDQCWPCEACNIEA